MKQFYKLPSGKVVLFGDDVTLCTVFEPRVVGFKSAAFLVYLKGLEAPIAFYGNDAESLHDHLVDLFGETTELKPKGK